MKRLAIYVHHDDNGDVREYILHCLKGLQEVVSDILFVVNGKITPESRKKLEKLKVEILVRENIGFDWSGWKAGIEFYGYDKIAKFEEVLLTNNTFYGPIYPFSIMWQKMEENDCDFWGINKHPEVDFYWIPNDENSKMLEHIQSYWIVFKQKILRSNDFKNYWQNVKIHKNFNEMVGYGETKLTDYFENRGYKSASYMDYEKYKKLIYSNPCFLTYKQVVEDCCPIAKRKYFFDFSEGIYTYDNNYSPRELINYLQQKTDYNTDLIWQDLLATQPLDKLNYALNLNFILPTNMANTPKKKHKAVVVFYIYPADLIDYCYKYMLNIPQNIDIVIVNTSPKVQRACLEKFAGLKNKIEYRMQPNRGRDNSALLVTCHDIFEKYEYLCFVHAKMSNYFQSAIQGEYFREHNFISLLWNENYIQNILYTLENNKFLGMLVPLLPNSSSYESLLTNQWTCNYDNALNFLNKKMKIKPIMANHLMGPMGGMYWCKTNALKTLKNYPWKYESFDKEPLENNDGLLTHIIERITTILAQYDGFYTAWVAPDFCGEAYLNSLYNNYCNLTQQNDELRLLLNQKSFHLQSLRYYKTKLKYWKYKLLSKITFGATKTKYQIKKKELKLKLRGMRQYLKHSLT